MRPLPALPPANGINAILQGVPFYRLQDQSAGQQKATFRLWDLALEKCLVPSFSLVC